jgi:Zn-dependent M28 family amino/carboxypeptidase
MLLLMATVTFAQKQTIEQAYVDRLIKTLAADDMQGRKTFEPSSQKAADFIEKEFKKIGLKTLPGLSGYKQTFSVNRIKPGTPQVKLNDQAIAAEKVFIVSSQPTLQWQSSGTSSPEVIMVGAQDSYSQKMGELMKAHKNALMLINPAHADIFTKYRNYFSKGGTSLASTAAEEGSMVFVLYEGETPASYQVQVTNQVQTAQISNVVGVLPGKKQKNENVVFSAHYDHIGILKPVDGDSIANGADDDASGTAAVIALARHFKKQKNNARTLLFVAFTAEEIGGYGSQYFSKQLDPDKVVAMFNIEMIGKPSKFGKSTAWITGYEKSDFGKILQSNLEGTEFNFHPDPYPSQDLFYRSDNATLARLGVPAHSISTDEIDIDKRYHSVDDEYDSLDIANMTQVIRAIARSASSIVAGKDTPSRVNAAALR